MSTPTDDRTQAGAGRAPASGPSRSPGRPRSEEAHQAIVAATIELLPEHGLRGLSIEAVAARAGVGKTTIYRRWNSKEELVADAVALLRPPLTPPDQGSLLADLQLLADIQRERLEFTSIPRIVPRVLSDAADDPELHALIYERAVEPLREMIAEMVRRAISRGEIRADADVEAIVDILHAIPVYRIVMGTDLAEALAPVPGRYIPLLLEGLAPR
ncbi:MAG TPA: TetR/AcrR family transcriptional regulator [Thermoleophilaceae bacterium]